MRICYYIPEWKRVRTLLTPTFSTGKIRDMCGPIDECVQLLCDNIGKIAQQVGFNVVLNKGLGGGV